MSKPVLVKNSKVRAAIYITTGVLQPIALYLLAIDVIGELEMALFTAETMFALTLAGLNTQTSEE